MKETHTVTALIWPILVDWAINSMNEWMKQLLQCIMARGVEHKSEQQTFWYLIYALRIPPLTRGKPKREYGLQPPQNWTHVSYSLTQSKKRKHTTVRFMPGSEESLTVKY